jgi:hypothetical protein
MKAASALDILQIEDVRQFNYTNALKKKQLQDYIKKNWKVNSKKNSNKRHPFVNQLQKVT